MLAQLSDPTMIARCEEFLESLKSGGTKPKVLPSPAEWVTNLGTPGSSEGRSPSLLYEAKATWDLDSVKEARTAFAQLPAEQVPESLPTEHAVPSARTDTPQFPPEHVACRHGLVGAAQ